MLFFDEDYNDWNKIQQLAAWRFLERRSQYLSWVKAVYGSSTRRATLTKREKGN